MNDTAITRPSPEQIAKCAYLIWENEGYPHGRNETHWLQAEKQLHSAYLHENATTVKPTASQSTRRGKAAAARAKQSQEAGT